MKLSWPGFSLPEWVRVWRRTPAAAAPAKPQQIQLIKAGALAYPALLVVALLAAVVVSAVAVTYSAYQYRLVFNKHQQLVTHRDELQIEWGQLVLEESAWAANSRVEEQAAKRLKMRIPEPKDIEIVRYEQ